MIEIELWIHIAYPDQVWLSSEPSSSLRSRRLVCSFRSTFSAQIEFSSPLYFAFLVAFVPFCPFLHALCHLPFAICHFAICIWLGKAIRKMQFPLHTHTDTGTHMWQSGKWKLEKWGAKLLSIGWAKKKKTEKKSPNSIDVDQIKSKANQCQLPLHFGDFGMQI